MSSSTYALRGENLGIFWGCFLGVPFAFAIVSASAPCGLKRWRRRKGRTTSIKRDSRWNVISNGPSLVPFVEPELRPTSGLATAWLSLLTGHAHVQLPAQLLDFSNRSLASLPWPNDQRSDQRVASNIYRRSAERYVDLVATKGCRSDTHRAVPSQTCV